MAFKIKTISGVDYLSGLTTLNLVYNNLTDEVVNNLVLPNSLQSLYLYNNQIVNFNPVTALPIALQLLVLEYNQIVTFNPTIPLPDSITQLVLGNNQMTTAGYTASEPWANAMSAIPGRGTIVFSNNVDSALGTNLRTILLAKGWGVNV